MSSNQRKRLIGLLLVLFVCLGSLTTPFRSFASFPEELRLFSGQEAHLNLVMPVSAQVTVNHPEIIKVNGSTEHSFRVDLHQPISLESYRAGKAEMKLKLFGAIPLKTVKVNVVPDLKVIPGGQTIGVKLKSAGIMVVGHHLVSVAEDKRSSPGEEAKVQLGDLIVKMNGKPIQDVSKVAELVKAAGESKKPIVLTIVRNNETLEIPITPAYDAVDKAYRLGLYIRDSAAGVGTLTFYAPDQGVYGALGHVITDMDTQTPIVVGGGDIVHSNVTSISKSQNGEPGEKRAQFSKESKSIGNIEKNTQFGIFGKMFNAPDHSLYDKAMPVAFAEEVREGPAQIYTVVNGQKVEKFDIEVVHVAKQEFPATKGMVIKITDPRLLDKTGGIVQGMSGSPIIQSGKVVGAVTHVFVNDPASGYGCFIEWMLQDAGIMLRAPGTITESESKPEQQLKAS
ncbi:SpoIVB peptidase [Paenibacillus validus]|uniref:SpoIVB peptidase n=1 Tax=Paenibacillus validus TaxID=44253 RepID=UPI001FCFDA74|nr:SpoIVB peptidase [Paenibacillus validus]MED4601592.1 SpoIVB peptidase [Paenibacillus validus]MED4607622.1 SpoIVB peptidase [Paenibacillus validus]